MPYLIGLPTQKNLLIYNSLGYIKHFIVCVTIMIIVVEGDSYARVFRLLFIAYHQQLLLLISDCLKHIRVDLYKEVFQQLLLKCIYYTATNSKFKYRLCHYFSTIIIKRRIIWK